MKHIPYGEYDCFLAALQYFVEKEGHGGKGYIAKNTGLSNTFIGDILKEASRKRAREKNRKKIAHFLQGVYQGNFDISEDDAYFEFLSFGRMLLTEADGDNEVCSAPAEYSNVVSIRNRHHTVVDEFPVDRQAAALELNEIARDMARDDPDLFDDLLEYARFRYRKNITQAGGVRAGTKKRGNNNAD